MKQGETNECSHLACVTCFLLSHEYFFLIFLADEEKRSKKKWHVFYVSMQKVIQLTGVSFYTRWTHWISLRTNWTLVCFCFSFLIVLWELIDVLALVCVFVSVLWSHSFTFVCVRWWTFTEICSWVYYCYYWVNTGWVWWAWNLNYFFSLANN